MVEAQRDWDFVTQEKGDCPIMTDLLPSDLLHKVMNVFRGQEGASLSILVDIINQDFFLRQ